MVCFKIFKSAIVLQSFGRGTDSVKPVLLVLAHRWVLNQTETRQSPWGLSSLRRDLCLCLAVVQDNIGLWKAVGLPPVLTVNLVQQVCGPQALWIVG